VSSKKIVGAFPGSIKRSALKQLRETHKENVYECRKSAVVWGSQYCGIPVQLSKSSKA
jgi:hypothetical protein